MGPEHAHGKMGHRRVRHYRGSEAMLAPISGCTIWNVLLRQELGRDWSAKAQLPLKQSSTKKDVVNSTLVKEFTLACMSNPGLSIFVKKYTGQAK